MSLLDPIIHTSVGSNAGRAVTTGNYNSFFGSFAGSYTTTGVGNIFAGYSAGINNNGSNNIFIGNSITAMGTASKNTLIGHSASNIISTGTENTVLEYSGDGDLDIVGRFGSVFINNHGTNKPKANSKPSAPTNLCVYFNGDQATFSWDMASDAETPATGLTYNLFVKQNGKFVLSPLADIVTGYRKILQRGNVDQNTSWTLTIPSGSNIEWGVQAIDNSYAGSLFATNTVAPTQTVCGTITSSTTIAGRDIITPMNCSPATVAVTNGATLNLEAANVIRLLPGFSAADGSFLNGKLIQLPPEQSPCRVGSGSSGRVDEPNETNKDESEDNIKVYPNPNNGLFKLMHSSMRFRVLWRSQ